MSMFCHIVGTLYMCLCTFVTHYFFDTVPNKLVLYHWGLIPQAGIKKDQILVFFSENRSLTKKRMHGWGYSTTSWHCSDLGSILGMSYSWKQYYSIRWQMNSKYHLGRKEVWFGGKPVWPVPAWISGTQKLVLKSNIDCYCTVYCRCLAGATWCSTGPGLACEGWWSIVSTEYLLKW